MSNSWDPVIDTGAYLDTLKRAEELAVEKGYNLNPDNERIEKVIGLMTMNFNETGRYFCPCKQSHPLDTEKDVICPCPELESEIGEDGNCFCKLFFS